MMRRTLARNLLAIIITIGVSGCVLSPRGQQQEKTNLQQAGTTYQTPAQKRQLPDLPPNPSWQQVLQRAFLANGDLEAAYFEWRAAYARIDQAATYPNSNVSLGFSYLFSGGQMKSWDRTTVSAGFDPAMNLSFPGKTAKAGEVALEEARAAGFRFQAAKFELQRRVLEAYVDLALAQEKIRVQQDNVGLLKLLTDTVANRLRAGGPQQDLLKVQVDYRLADNDLHNLQTDADTLRAMLNGLLARDPSAPLDIHELPPARPVPATDAKLIAVAVDRNPELAAFARQVQGRRDALELARMAYIPDVNPSAAFTGGVSQSIGAAIMLPTTFPKIQAAIDEAQSMLRSSEAASRQAGRDRAASFVAALYAMRNAERQRAVFEDEVLPAAQQALNSSRQAYATANVPFADLIDAQRTLLQVRLLIAQVRAEREKRLAEMEALAGTDIETVAPATARTTQPSSGGERS